MIQNIEINKLHPHCDNPRKDLGDLTELTESIKTNGVLQNLTVVPWFSSITGVGCDDPKQQEEMGYTVVIGHRRLKAAELAGLMELPCLISDMSRREQVATMLLENMQREDLTIWEQAQGFQMMLDLGDSVTDIAGRTGFSESTVRRRVKLLDLDDDKFKAADARGATLQDYLELDKIKDINRKNAVLDKIGTANFQYDLRKAISDEEQEARIAAWVELLSAFAAQVDNDEGYSRVAYYYTGNEPKAERPDDADTVEYFFYIGKWGSIYLMKKGAERPRENPEEAKKRERDEYRRTSFSDATNRAHELRAEFIKGVSATKIKKNMAAIVTMGVWSSITSYVELDTDDFFAILGVSPETVEKDDEEEGVSHNGLLSVINTSPERSLLAMVYCLTNDRPGMGYYRSWSLEHEENEDLDRLYDLLIALGYEMSDEEKALRDGTHELFDKPKDQKPETEPELESENVTGAEGEKEDEMP